MIFLTYKRIIVHIIIVISLALAYLSDALWHLSLKGLDPHAYPQRAAIDLLLVLVAFACGWTYRSCKN